MSIVNHPNNSLSLAMTAVEDFLVQYPQGVIVIWGATATGKTSLSLEMAELFSTPHRNPLLGGEGGTGNKKYVKDVSLRQYKTTPEYILPLAQAMRASSTKAEEFFWHKVKNRKLDGKKRRRQHPFGRYIADFYCDELKLVVEVDGGVHLDSDVFTSDYEKTTFISSYGVTVLRFSNEEVLHTWESVAQKIQSYDLPSPSRTSVPLVGRKAGDEVFQPSIEIISADSRQVYRGMDIGTDKISVADQQGVPHRGLDLVDPDEEFTAGQWKSYTEQKITEIQSRGNIPVVVGGTGLYIDMLYRNFSMPTLAPQRERRAEMMTKEHNEPGRLYEELVRIDPEEAKKHHTQSHRYLLRALEIWQFTGKTKTARSGEHPVKRPLLMLGLWRGKEETNALIDERIEELFDRGLVEEVRGLLDSGYTSELQSMQGIGYKEIVGYLQGEYDLLTAKELLKQHTHRLAKRQRTRFRRYLHDAEKKPKEQVAYRTLFL